MVAFAYDRILYSGKNERTITTCNKVANYLNMTLSERSHIHSSTYIKSQTRQNNYSIHCIKDRMVVISREGGGVLPGKEYSGCW